MLDHYAGTYGVSLFAGDELKEVYIGQLSSPPITLLSFTERRKMMIDHCQEADNGLFANEDKMPDP